MHRIALSLILTCLIPAASFAGGTGSVVRARAEKIVESYSSWSLQPARSVDSINPNDFTPRTTEKEFVVETSATDYGFDIPAAFMSKAVFFDRVWYEPTKTIPIPTEWYDIYHARYGSRIYWILAIARDRSKRGEDVSDLKARFDFMIRSWVYLREK